MNLLEKRDVNSDEILKKRHIKRVMKESAKDIDQAQRKYMTSHGFTDSDFYNKRSFVATEDGLVYTHLKKHRFVDMKVRKTPIPRRKKAHPIHNKIIWGHYNNIIKELHFGFTTAVMEELRHIKDEE